ncbi:MAG: cyclic nucleotide-binding domain-containing protein [Chloroflexi bacterium]|nr:cyclic nucleotide-binding domain-containing protein [Chloroflexota bacterium]
MATADTLKKFALFQGLSDKVVGKVAAASSTTSHQAGKLLFREGDKAEEICLLVKGRIAVERQLPLAWPNPVVSIYTVAAGQVLGWSAVVQPGLRTASAKCLEDCEVILIKGKDLLEILDKNRDDGFLVMKRLADIVASSLAGTNDQLMREMAMLESYTTQAPRTPQ